jgi:hypothetical protein
MCYVVNLYLILSIRTCHVMGENFLEKEVKREFMLIFRELFRGTLK